MLQHDDEGRCLVCGLLYVHDAPTDRALHRTRHRAALRVVAPKPETTRNGHAITHNKSIMTCCQLSCADRSGKRTRRQTQT
jgi:hypothetical protein